MNYKPGHINIVGEPNLKNCIIKGDNLCVVGPYETMHRFYPQMVP